MKYYRLEDREHKDIIVKANGAEQYIYINGKWIRTGIMIESINDSMLIIKFLLFHFC